jgi:hypothetical protein
MDWSNGSCWRMQHSKCWMEPRPCRIGEAGREGEMEMDAPKIPAIVGQQFVSALRKHRGYRSAILSSVRA